MRPKQDFGNVDGSNDAWNRLRNDLNDWEKVHPTAQFISPHQFKSLYPYYERYTKQSFSDAYFLLLEKRCKLIPALFFRFSFEENSISLSLTRT